MGRALAIVLGIVTLVAVGGWAEAVPFTITKAQEAQGWSHDAPYASWGWTPAIGSNPPFGTTKIVVDRVGGDLELKVYTTFTGAYFAGGDCFGSICANAADMAITLDDGTPNAFEYGIALGKQQKTAGFYEVSSWATSRDIWSSRGGFVYGGKWDTCTGADCFAPKDADVRITGGTKLNDVTVTDQGTYLDVLVKGWSPATSFDLFWGTADCSNDPIFGDPPAPVPVPATLTLLGTGAGLALLLRRRRAASRIA